MITLRRVDPDHHMDRWYSVAIQPSLLDTVAIICTWGSRRTRYQRLRVLSAESLSAAQTTAEEIVSRKLRRGYRST